MKKIILSLSLLVTVGISAVSATPGNAPDPRVEKLFKKEFAGAEHVKWGEEEGYISAVFVLGGQRTHAWFSQDGELLGSIRGIFYNQLPLTVIRSIQSRFAAAAVYDIAEITNMDGTRYKLTLEYKGKKYRVAVFPDGNIDETQKLKK